MDFLTVGIPSYAPAKLKAGSHRGRLRVLHAPSDHAAKGTDIIREAVNRLRTSGAEIDLVEITGRSHEDVLRALSDCEIVIDQAFSDQPMPGLATEASAYGLPVIIGSCDWPGVVRGMDPRDIPPTIRCHPHEIAKVLKTLVADSSQRRERGAIARAYVIDRWSPRLVAERYLQIISGDIPTSWWRDPTHITYVHGVGMSEERSAEVIGSVLRDCGLQALQLDDKPRLRERVASLTEKIGAPM